MEVIKENLEERFKREWEAYKQENKRTFFPNILIAGASGAGKSSLINTIFGKAEAKVSSVKPETQGFHVYYGKDYGRKVNLIDSAGYETNQAEPIMMIYQRQSVKVLMGTQRISPGTQFPLLTSV